MNIKRTFNSIEECLQQVENKPRNKNINQHDLASINGNYFFTETKTIEEALALARSGWPKGKEIIKNLTEKHEGAFRKLFPQQDFETKMMPSNEGEVVNIDAYLQGQPEDMLHLYQDEERLQKLTSGKMQRIIISSSISCNVTCDTLFNRGCIIASMINIMELYGFRTELWLCFNSKTYGHSIQYYFKLKTFNEDLDLNNLAFSSCHPSMLRRVMFALVEQEEDNDVVKNYILNYYGRPCNLNDKEIETFGGELTYGNIYFEIMTYNKTFKQLLEETEIKLMNHFTKIKI